MPDEKKPSEGEQKPEAVKVGDKVYTAGDVQNMLGQLQANSQTVSKVSGILNACERYGLDPESFLQQAEGAFSVVGNLLQDGVIDKQGNILKKSASENGRLGEDPSNGTPPVGGDAKFLLESLNQVKASVEGYSKKITEMEEVQTSMLRSNFHDRIKNNYKNLSDEDVTRVFGLAMRDKTKTLFQHAQEASNHKAKLMNDLRAEHAKEFGVDLESFDQNKLLMQDPRGAAAAKFAGKKFSFRNKEGSIKPKDAMTAYFKALDAGG